MKTAYLLFGLASAACAPTSPEPQYPLCDDTGAPACGNIGQVGRSEKAPATRVANPEVPAAAGRATATFANAVAETTQHIVPVVTRVLVGASREVQRVTPFSRPLVDNREQVVCGNVMSKGGGRRVCRDARGTVVTETAFDDGDPFTP